MSDLIFNSLQFYKGLQPNISKLLQIQSAMWRSTIVSIVLENVESSLELQGHSSSLVRKRDGGCLTFYWVFSSQNRYCYSKSCKLFEMDAFWSEMLVLTEIASRRRHERRKGRAVDVNVA